MEILDINQISPDQVVLWQWLVFKLNATILYTWIVMALLTIGSWVVTRKLSTGPQISRWQNLVEIVVTTLRQQIRQIGERDPRPYLAFVGTLFLFIALSNLLAVVPGFEPPTASLSTTTALALCVFVAVPFFSIAEQGVMGYLKHFVRPNPLMLPFEVISELSRTLALAVRLFGNIMSGTKIVAILLAVAPLIFPIVMDLLGLLTGLIQAYIFSVLSMVYIASASRVHSEFEELEEEHARQTPRPQGEGGASSSANPSPEE